jgi:ABC-type glycerol-3-phosphate transport system substrate-binding protein
MRKAFVVACAVVLILFSLSGCPARRDGLVVWSFTDEVGNMINDFYLVEFPDANINYAITIQEQYENRLDPVLASGRGVPDVIVMEAAFVRKYVESGHLLDITDIYEANRHKILPYTVEVGTYNGRVYGLSWQATPGAMFYRRSLAQKYLGTDDPEVVQTYFSDVNTFLNTARFLSEASNGACVTVASRGDIFQFMFATREQPWIVDGRLVIDSNLERYMDIAKIMYDNRWEGRVGQWSEGWFAGMNGALRDERGPLEVFAYFLPTWGLHYVLKTNTPQTSGDWAMIQGPMPYRWGGTWIGAWRGTSKADEARHLIEFLTTNDDFLRAWALQTGDFVSNMDVVNEIKHDFSEPFLGGQNHYAAFAEKALGVNGRLLQGTDRTIEGYWHETVESYVLGEKTREQALADFRNQIESLLGL